MNAIAQEITPTCALLRKWLARLPHPFTAQDRGVSILQAELTCVRPGRVFFEEVENVGRPDHVQLIFDRRVTRRPPCGERPRRPGTLTHRPGGLP